MKKLTLLLTTMLVAIAAQAWTVYFTNPDSWNSVGIWAYAGSNNLTGSNWPGTTMTKLANGYWSYSGSGTLPQNVIFNSNVANNAAQSETFTFTDNALYNRTAKVEYTACYVTLAGGFNGWDWDDKSKIEVTGNSSTGIATFDFYAIGNSDFQIKVWDGNKDLYYGNYGNEINTDQWVSLNSVVNDKTYGTTIKIKGAASNQKFKVEFNIPTGQIKVTPEPLDYPEKIYVRGDKTNWLPSEDYVLECKGMNPANAGEIIYEGTFSEFSGNFILGDATATAENDNSNEAKKSWGFLYGATGEDPFISNDEYHDAWPGSTANFLLRSEIFENATMTFYYKLNEPSSSLYFIGTERPLTIPKTVKVRVYDNDSADGVEDTSLTDNILYLESEEPNEKGEYIYRGVMAKLSGYFKIADDSYSQFNYGYGVNGTENDKLVYSGHTNKARYITDGYKNFEVGEGGTIYNAHITFYYNPNDESEKAGEEDVLSWLNIKGTPPHFNVRGINLNDWAEGALKLTPAFTMEAAETAEEGFYVYYGKPNGLTGDFKVAYNDWTLNYGATNDGSFDKNVSYVGKEGGNDYVAQNALRDGVLLFYYRPFGESQIVFTTHSDKAYVVSDGEGPEFNHDYLNEMFVDYIGLTLDNVDKPTPRGEYIFKGNIPANQALKGGLRIVDGVDETSSNTPEGKVKRIAAITSATGAVDHGLMDGDVSIGELTQGNHVLVKGGTGKLTLDENRLESAEFTFTYQPNTNMTTTLAIGGGVTTGVENIHVESSEGKTYYNLQGIPVTNPTRGEVYIVREGNKAQKVMIK